MDGGRGAASRKDEANIHLSAFLAIHIPTLSPLTHCIYHHHYHHHQLTQLLLFPPIHFRRLQAIHISHRSLCLPSTGAAVGPSFVILAVTRIAPCVVLLALFSSTYKLTSLPRSFLPFVSSRATRDYSSRSPVI